MLCYNCRRELDKSIKTKEHIPAQAFYVGYSEEYKINRITVPACKKCNEGFSKTDQELRDAIGVTNDKGKHNEEYTRKSISSILKKNGKNKLHFDSLGNVEKVGFEYSPIRKSAIKDFKGIFYYKFGYPLSKEWRVEIVANFEKQENVVIAAKGMYAYVNKGINWSVSGHEDIFRYKLKTLVPDIHGVINDTGEVDKAVSIASILEYHKRFSFVVVAAKHERINSLIKRPKKKKNRRKDIKKQILRNKALKRLRHKLKCRK